MYALAERYFLIPLYITLLFMAFTGLFFPVWAMAFKNAVPRFYKALLIIAVLMAFPLLLRGWEIGIAYLKINKNHLFDNSVWALPFLFLTLFMLSLWIQALNQKKLQTTSLTLAVFVSAMISPFIYLALMQSWLRYLE